MPGLMIVGQTLIELELKARVDTNKCLSFDCKM